MGVGQRRETFPDRDTHWEIQDISKNWVTLWARRIQESSFLPLSGENEDWDTKHQRIEHRSVKHGDKGRVQGRSARFLYPGHYGMLPETEIAGLPTQPSLYRDWRGWLGEYWFLQSHPPHI